MPVAPPENQRFPTQLVAASGAVSLLLLALVLSFTLKIYQEVLAHGRSAHDIQQLRGEILRLDEVLTMSAHMAANSLEPQWRQRYQASKGPLATAIAEAGRLVGPGVLNAAIFDTGQANEQLLALERQAFEQLERGQPQAARALLGSPDYALAKRAYAAGMQMLNEQLQAQSVQLLQSGRDRLRLLAAAAVLIVILLTLLWLLVWLRVRSWRQRATLAETRLRESRADVLALNQRLEARVQEKSAELRQSNDLLHGVIETAPVVLFALDAKGRFTLSLGSALQRLGLAPNQVVGESALEMYAEFPKVVAALEKALAGEACEVRAELPQGVFDTHYFPVNSDTQAVLGIAYDVSDSVESGRKLLTMSAAIEQNPTAILIVDLDGHVEYANQRAENLLQIKPNSPRGDWRALKELFDAGYLFDEGLAELRAGRRWRHQMLSNLPGRGAVWLSLDASPLLDEFRNISHYLLTVQDISQRKSAEQRAETYANVDVLTGLPNRKAARERLEHLLHTKDARLALLWIDLDGFKRINDGGSHQTGDQLLAIIADRLRSVVSEQGLASRLGGDEFLLAVNESEQLAAQRTANRLLAKIAEPVHLADSEIVLTASIGVVMARAGEGSVDGLMRVAELAMYEAKTAGKNTVYLLDADPGAAGRSLLQIESALRKNIGDPQLQLHYQPILDCSSGEVCAVEALLRWNSPELGRMSPADFIPIAEHSDLIVALGEWILGEAIRQARAWQLAGKHPLRVAVNCSARHFVSEGFVNYVEMLLEEHQLPGELLEIEVTEGVLLSGGSSLTEQFLQLRKLGVRVSIDDFGTGYSSLSYLRKFSFDTLKIDRSFVSGVLTDSGDLAVCEAILAMARALDLNVIAEGVEHEDEWTHLRKLGCSMMQGFLFSPALPPAELEVWLAERKHPA